MQLPTPFSRRTKPEIKLHELYGKTLIQDGSNFSSGFSGSTIFAKKKLKDIEPIFAKTDIWMMLFTLVNLHFKNETDLKEKLVGFARAEAEKQEGQYEVSEHGVFTAKVKDPANGKESTTNVLKVVVRLKQCQENKDIGLYFDNFHACFEFIEQDDNILFLVKMLYSRSANFVFAWIQDKTMANIKVIMKEALRQCMNTAWTRVCDFEAFKQKELMWKKKIVFDIPKNELRGYDYGVRAAWPVPALPADVSLFLTNLNNYQDIHERFTTSNTNQLHLVFLETPLVFDIQFDKSKIILTAKKGILAISCAQFVFDLKAKGKETEVTIDFTYKMGWFLDMFSGTVKQLAGKVLVTALRHLAMGFAPAPSALNVADIADAPNERLPQAAV